MANAPQVETVLAWHAALNAGDFVRLLALSAEDVEVGGPRGSGRGADLLREWFGRAGIRLEPRRTFRRDDTVVVEQAAAWLSASGKLGAPRTVASVFRVRDGRVASVMRYEDVGWALRAAGFAPASGEL
jgi:ketosteroid isomerase-like protein